MLKQRIWAAVVFVPVVFGAVFWGGLLLDLAVGALCLAMAWEFFRMLGIIFAAPYRVGLYGLASWVIAEGLGHMPASPLGMLPTLVLACGLLALLQPEPIERATARLGGLVLGLGYACGFLPFLARLRALPEDGLLLALVALLATWSADTGAYFAGRAFGKHKLYPKVSPKKTWEGLAGGILAGGLAALGLGRILDGSLATGHWIALGGLCAISGALGDLFESLIKRSCGAKDSSALIPGHGGVLDRFDGVLFAAPSVFAYVYLWG